MSAPKIAFAPLLGSLRVFWTVEARLRDFHAKSPVGWALERTWGLAQFVSPATWIWGTRAYSHSLPVDQRDPYETKRSRRVDYYIVAWFVALIAVFVAAYLESPRPPGWWLIAVGTWRVADVIQANVNMHVFDGVRIRLDSHRVASLLRSTLIAVWNYVELIAWFALFYLRSGGLRTDPPGSPVTLFDALYFSTVTQLTIGFGDLKPATNVARLLAMGQGMLGTLFLIFAISRFAGLLPKAGEHDDECDKP